MKPDEGSAGRAPGCRAAGPRFVADLCDVPIARGAGISSPCNSVCRIDERSGWCLGCYRTLDEIARWSAMSAAIKRTLCTELPARRQLAHQPGRTQEAGP
jgi:predicted Fe-S protein YdhL (DUF1289 family)